LAQAEATMPLKVPGSSTPSGIQVSGRKPSYTREQFDHVREMLGQQALGVSQIARDTKLTGRRSIASRMIRRALRPL
jgi:hypothetical protein